jgi:hypothetical protein
LISAAGHQPWDYDLQFVAVLPPAAADSPDPLPPAGTAAASEFDFISSDEDNDNRVGSG